MSNAVNGPAKSWINFNGTGTVAVLASFNLSSITDNGTGDYTINFTTAMPDAAYAFTGSILGRSADLDLMVLVPREGGYTAGSIRVSGRQGNHNYSAASDTAVVTVAIFR